MKKILVFTLAAAVVLIIAAPGAWAQESATDEFNLEEITVTAERREGNVQKIAASVQALPGSDLLEQGKITTEQILEDVPNVTFIAGKGENPNGNIAIRGLQSTQDSGVGGAGPSVTATYVDEVFQGIGGNYDVNRVEVLRGPQGTLYGRSSPAGVVAFHTNNPKLDEFSADVSAETGDASLINIQGAVNAPVNDKLALRAAAHYFEKDSYYAGEGVSSKTKEGRLKILYQPVEELSLLASVSAQKNTSTGGGYSQILTAPNEIDYKGDYVDPTSDLPQTYRQASLEANYDLGGSTLTYIGAIHDYESEGLSAPRLNKGNQGWMVSEALTPENKYITHEVRLASNSEDRLTWIVGANYFQHDFDTVNNSIQTSVPPLDPYPTAADLAANPSASADDIIGAIIFYEAHKGTMKNSGIFTEETFEVNDAFRITAGLRYDNTKLEETTTFTINNNLNDAHTSLKPEDFAEYPNLDKQDFDNITYKLRFEYDLTPDNMIYALTSTGFMPGKTGASPIMGPGGVEGFNLLVVEEKKLTAYEVGSKNQLLDNRLRINGDVYYYEYEGYQEAINITEGQPGPPFFTLVSVPLKMFGVEVSAEWLVTPRDRVRMDLGYLSSEIDEHTNIPGYGSTEQFMTLKDVPGHPPLQATLSYDHNFLLGNGSVLVPRVQMRYMDGYYLDQITQYQLDSLVPAGYDPGSYVYQDAYAVTDISFTWTSPDDNYSLTGYLRNALDEEYKTSVALPTATYDEETDTYSVSNTAVDVGDPRAWGLMFTARF